jgi:hypothetical protein
MNLQGKERHVRNGAFEILDLCTARRAARRGHAPQNHRLCRIVRVYEIS